MGTGLYCRVSTQDQDLNRQKDETWNYATNRLNVDPTAIVLYDDTGTGTDTDRSGFQDMMRSVRADEIDRVVVLEMSRLSRSVRDFSATLEELKKNNCGLHIVNRGMDLDPEDEDPLTEAFFYLAGIFAQLEAQMIRERTISGVRAAKEAGKWTGRPPYGFDTDDAGYLVMNDNYDRAMAILDELGNGESIRSLARRFGIARGTVRHIRDNAEWYREQGQGASAMG